MVPRFAATFFFIIIINNLQAKLAIDLSLI